MTRQLEQRPGAQAAHVGAAARDLILRVELLEAYARLRTATNLTVQLTRRGKPLTINFNIK